MNDTVQDTSAQGFVCRSCGSTLVERPGHTPEQRWCGRWFDCPNKNFTTHACTGSALVPSDELRAQHAALAGEGR